MKKEITIYTSNNMYAYNLRNKLLKEGWYIDYLNEIDDFIQWLKEKDSALVFVDASDVAIIEKIHACVGSKLNDFLIIYLDEKNQLQDFDISQKYICNINNIVLRLKDIEKEYQESFENDLENQIYGKSISEVLSSFGISPKYKGYAYLLDCIKMGLDSNVKFIRYSSEIYPIIAKNFQVSTSSVEKSVRTAIKKACSRFPELFSNDFFKKGHVTNNEFMNYIIERMSRKNRL